MVASSVNTCKQSLWKRWLISDYFLQKTENVKPMIFVIRELRQF